MLRRAWPLALALVLPVGCKSAGSFAKTLATVAAYTAVTIAAAALEDLANGTCYRDSACADDESCDRESHRCVPIAYAPIHLRPFAGCRGDERCELEEREAREEDERLLREAAERAATRAPE
ncbi:MAG: hypothetical protein IT373_19945 [Polyangiaceae bacterium]|nr:hypothetical protein [Polyangiaceae bacterium]